MPDAWIDRLFARLSAMYGSRFSDLWKGCDLASVRAIWANDLGVMSREELAAGVAACRNRDWPPSLPEFLKLCRPPVDFGAALYEAIEQMVRRESGSDRWSHPAIFWAAQSLSFELRNCSRKDLEPLWRTALSEEMGRGQWADVPARLKSLPPPALPEVRPGVHPAIADFLDKFGKASEGHDFLLWAKKPRSEIAFESVKELAKKGDLRFVEILQQHVENGVCDDSRKMRKRWRYTEWVEV